MKLSVCGAKPLPVVYKTQNYRFSLTHVSSGLYFDVLTEMFATNKIYEKRKSITKTIEKV